MSMDYALAKELYDAGFHAKSYEGAPASNIDYTDGVPVTPTLEELIEACGEPITLWIMCNRTDAQRAGTEIMQTGATPTEAVARLWLALNKNMDITNS